MKDKMNDFETNSKNKIIRNLYREVYVFTKGHQPATNLVKEEHGNMLPDFHSILNRPKNYFSQLLNVRGDNNASYKEMQRAVPLEPESRPSEVKTLLKF
jgi:hypothetical protein